MKKYPYLPAVPLMGGAAAFALRLLQNRTGFEQDTGLPIPGNLFARLVPLALIVLAAALAAAAWRLPKDGEKSAQLFTGSFSAKSGVVAALWAGGCLLWVASGALEALQAAPLLGVIGGGGLISASGVISPRLSVLMGALTAVSGAAVLPVASACRRGAPAERNARLGNLLLIPTACLVVRLVLTYRADSVDPSLTVYYVELLALALLILGLYRASSFAFHCGRTRRFVLYAGAALILCLTTLADRHTLAAALLYLGGAAQMLALLTARAEALAGLPSKRA